MATVGCLEGSWERLEGSWELYKKMTEREEELQEIISRVISRIVSRSPYNKLVRVGGFVSRQSLGAPSIRVLTLGDKADEVCAIPCNSVAYMDNIEGMLKEGLLRYTMAVASDRINNTGFSWKQVGWTLIGLHDTKGTLVYTIESPTASSFFSTFDSIDNWVNWLYITALRGLKSRLWA